MADTSPVEQVASLISSGNITIPSANMMEIDELSDDDLLIPIDTPKTSAPTRMNTRPTSSRKKTSRALDPDLVEDSNKRKKLDPEQVAYLKEYYATNTKPTSDDMMRIAANLELEDAKVKNWFTNMRFKERKVGKGEGSSPAPTSSQSAVRSSSATPTPVKSASARSQRKSAAGIPAPAPAPASAPAPSPSPAPTQATSAPPATPVASESPSWPLPGTTRRASLSGTNNGPTPSQPQPSLTQSQPFPAQTQTQPSHIENHVDQRRNSVTSFPHSQPHFHQPQHPAHLMHQAAAQMLHLTGQTVSPQNGSFVLLPPNMVYPSHYTPAYYQPSSNSNGYMNGGPPPSQTAMALEAAAQTVSGTTSTSTSAIPTPAPGPSPPVSVPQTPTHVVSAPRQRAKRPVPQPVQDDLESVDAIGYETLSKEGIANIQKLMKSLYYKPEMVAAAAVADDGVGAGRPAMGSPNEDVEMDTVATEVRRPVDVAFQGRDGNRLVNPAAALVTAVMKPAPAPAAASSSGSSTSSDDSQRDRTKASSKTSKLSSFSETSGTSSGSASGSEGGDGGVGEGRDDMEEGEDEEEDGGREEEEEEEDREDDFDEGDEEEFDEGERGSVLEGAIGRGGGESRPRDVLRLSSEAQFKLQLFFERADSGADLDAPPGTELSHDKLEQGSAAAAGVRTWDAGVKE
ncbi:hypothetical protein BC829DRAFT_112234 [Chytridium lagenaria]|nr:hypothetical protein BC829DRAFT_112234 [Chytridium lagenaria]